MNIRSFRIIRSSSFSFTLNFSIKVKAFRAQFRGVSGVVFFLFRSTQIYALIRKKHLRKLEQNEKQCKNDVKEKSITFAMLFLFVTSSGETSNFWMEDLERVLRLESFEIEDAFEYFFKG